MSLRFDVEPDEHILKTALARSFQPPSHQRKAKFKAYFFAEGRLYLTNLRLVWRRSWFNVPFVPVHSFEIPLEEIQSCSVRGTGFAMAFGGGGLCGHRWRRASPSTGDKQALASGALVLEENC